MATGGVRTLRKVLLFFVFSAGSFSVGAGVTGNIFPGVKWGLHNPTIIVGKPTVLQIQVTDDTSTKNTLIALTSKLEVKGSSCDHLSTPALHLRSHASHHIYHLHLRSYHTQKLEPGPAWICISKDGYTWIHQGYSTLLHIK